MVGGGRWSVVGGRWSVAGGRRSAVGGGRWSVVGRVWGRGHGRRRLACSSKAPSRAPCGVCHCVVSGTVEPSGASLDGTTMTVAACPSTRATTSRSLPRSVVDARRRRSGVGE
eukprot:5147786-Prymnesium_polylepis.1